MEVPKPETQVSADLWHEADTIDDLAHARADYFRCKRDLTAFTSGASRRQPNSEAMKMQRRGDLSATRQDAHKNSVPLFSIQHRIQILQKELSDFNDRIAELESAGHRGRMIEGLNANAINFARQIDELRCFLVEPTKARKLHP